MNSSRRTPRRVTKSSRPTARPSTGWWRALNENGGGENAPRPGEAMPPFLLPDETGRLVSLASLLAHGPVAVMFFRGHWCPYCRLNVRAVIKAMDESRRGRPSRCNHAGDAEICREIQGRGGAPFPILTDLDNGYALSLNLAIWLGTEIQRLLAYLDLASFHGNDGWVLPIPATFVVGRDGLVKARFVDPDFRKRMEIDDLLAALKHAGAGALGASGSSALVQMDCRQSAPRSIRIMADATAVRSRPATP